MQVGFVSVRALAAWLWLDKVTFCCCKLFLRFVAITVFSFLVSVLFVAVGLDKIRKPLHLLVAVGSYFFVCRFHFIPLVVELLHFHCTLGWTMWLTVLLKNSFKIIPGFTASGFCFSSLG